MEAKVTWLDGMSFKGTADSKFEVTLGAAPDFGGQDDGFRPLELILLGLAGCTAMDVLSILKKKHQNVQDFDVRLSAKRAEVHPKVFTEIEMEYVVCGERIEREAVERAVELSLTKYCSAHAMLAKAVSIKHTITVL